MSRPILSAEQLAAMRLKYKTKWEKEALENVSQLLTDISFQIVEHILYKDINTNPEINRKIGFCKQELTILLAENLTAYDIEEIDPEIDINPEADRVFSLIVDFNERGEIVNEMIRLYSEDPERTYYGLPNEWKEKTHKALEQVVEYIVERSESIFEFNIDNLSPEQKLEIKNLFWINFR